MDAIDQAQRADAFFQAIALRQPLKPPVVSAVFTGLCLNCEVAVDYPRRWCNADCRDDWEKENKSWQH